VNGNSLIGQGANKIIGHHMEIGAWALSNITSSTASLDRNARKSRSSRSSRNGTRTRYMTVGTEELTMDILGVRVPKLEIP
jgi:HPr kinase/phosphorylase